MVSLGLGWADVDTLAGESVDVTVGPAASISFTKLRMV